VAGDPGSCAGNTRRQRPGSGRLAWEDGDHSVAATLLERSDGKRRPASVWFDLGLVRQDLRDYDQAAAAYRKALDKKA